ncbi:MAG: OadG family protein [Gammaproteobacteria bacterium]|nr:OadG family protein [Gammaproteobacteria bacterium]
MDKLQPLIIESAQLMLIGMGTVFIILILLIFMINLVSKLLMLFKLEGEQETIRTAFGVAGKKPASSDQQLIAVISSAISSYKKQHPTN